MQSKNAIAIVHVITGMCGMYKLCVHHLEHRRWTHVGTQTLDTRWNTDVGHTRWTHVETQTLDTR